MKEKSLKYSINEWMKFTALSTWPPMVNYVLTIFFLWIASLFWFAYPPVLLTWVTMGFSFIIFSFALYKRMGAITLKDIGLKKISWHESVIIIVILLALGTVIYKRGIIDSALAFIILQQLIVCVSEEFWARGILICKLKQMKLSKLQILIVSSIAFAFLIHSGASLTENVIYRLPISIIFGLTFLSTGKLYLPIALHFLNNIIAYTGF